MKKALRVLVVAFVTVAFAGVSFAAEKAKTTKATGEVTSVDAKAGTLTVKAKDKDLKLTADTKAKGALGKVKVGDMVKVTYTEKEGKMIASSIAGVKGTAKKADTAMEKSKAMETPGKKAEEKKAATK